VESAPSRDWISISPAELSAGELTAWATRPECGAVVTFCGTVRNRSAERDDVEALEYETSVALAEARICEIVATARSRWPGLVAVAVHHRTGRVELGQDAVVVTISAPHRHEAFAAAQFCIDTLKESVPIYKRDIWPGGSAWSNDARTIVDVPEG
jgi:molybdopterin synthase catalytic subunit